LFLLIAAPLHAQQTGALSGKALASDGSLLPGVTVEATSPVLPTPRVTVTGTMGEYRMPALPPGPYTVTFTLSGMTTVTRQAEVQLAQDTMVEATLGVGGVSETVEVTATASLIERDASSVKSSVVSEQIQQLPVGQQYRDLVKLIPGVMYTQDGTRGPSAGGSGQDNAYQFDGVNACAMSWLAGSDARVPNRGSVTIRVAREELVRPRVLHVEPLHRQLRPGQLHDGQRRQRLHRVVVHR
jgi:hypothetical protein